MTLRAVVVAGGSTGRAEFVADVTGSLNADEAVARDAIAERTAAQLLEQDPAWPSRIRLTDAGRQLSESAAAESAGISARLYAAVQATTSPSRAACWD